MVEERFTLMVLQRTGGQPVPPEQLEAIRPQWRPQIVEALIDDQLMETAVVKEEITLEDAEVVGFLQRSLEAQLLINDMTREDLAARIQAAEGKTLEEYMQSETQNPDLRQSLLQAKLVEKAFPEVATITDEDVLERYEGDMKSVLAKPAMVRASHILIGTQDLATDEEKANAKVQAEALVVQARAAGADFAALAKEHSTGPSGPQGGDLGFFPREGAMVEPFAAAAFDLQVDQVSGVVESQFGYHIILVTERKEERLVPLAEAAPWIRDEIRFQRIGPLRAQYVATLRAAAAIQYAEGEGAVVPMPASSPPKPAQQGEAGK